MYGERIKEKRKEFGLTREDLALRFMQTTQTIKLWEEEQIEPSITELIILATDFNTSIDWLVGKIDDEVDDENDDSEENCEECEDFLECKLIPHMHNFIENNEEAAYVHAQLAIDGEDEDCVIYSGSTTAILSTINMLLKSLSIESKADYYDLVALMASVYTKSELGGLFGDDE